MSSMPAGQRTVNYVYGLQPQQEPFPLVHYLSVESARVVLSPDRILFHVGEMPHGPWFDRIRPHLEIVQVEALAEVASRRRDRGVEVFSYAHQTDVLRLDALLEHGGLYLDIDTLTLADFPRDWWDEPFLLGKESGHTVDLPGGQRVVGLLNAVMMAQPGAPFARAWRERIIPAMDGGWTAHSNQLAALLADEMPGDVRVVPGTAFCRFPPTIEGLRALLMPSSRRDEPDLEGAFVLHLSQHLWWERKRHDFLPFLSGADIDETYVRDGLSLYARCAQQFMPAKTGRRRRKASGHQICYVGHDGPSGYGVAARRAVRALRSVGLDVAWQPLHCDLAGRWYLGKAVDSAGMGDSGIGGPCEVLIGHTPPDHAGYYRLGFDCERYAAHTVWETDRLPPSWEPLLNGSKGRVDAVVVPSEWNASAFRAGGVRTPVYAIPHVAVAESILSSPEPLGLELSDDLFVFYVVSAWSERKGVGLVLDAYLNAFTGSDPVVLVIKTDDAVQLHPGGPWPPPGSPEMSTAWPLADKLRRFKRPARVVLETGNWSDGRVAALHRRGDCYFSMARGEGWGLGSFDAASIGKLVITPGHGGPLAYLGQDYPWLVSGRPVETSALGLDRPGNWFEPDRDHAVELLRRAVDSRDDATSLALREKLAREIVHECAPAQVAALIASACGLVAKVDGQPQAFA